METKVNWLGFRSRRIGKEGSSTVCVFPRDPTAPLSGQSLMGDGSDKNRRSVMSERGLVPSLTRPQESIKAQQVVWEGHSANHLLELLVPRGAGTSPHEHQASADRYFSWVRGKSRYQKSCWRIMTSSLREQKIAFTRLALPLSVKEMHHFSCSEWAMFWHEHIH